MNKLQVGEFLSKVERALPVFREVDALVAGGDSLSEVDAARRDNFLPMVALWTEQLLGPDLAEVRDWLGKPQRDLLDEKIRQLRVWQERIEAA